MMPRVAIILLLLLVLATVTPAATLECGPASGLPDNVCRTVDFLNAPVNVGSNSVFDDLAQFDPSLGKLTGVEVVLFGAGDMEGARFVSVGPDAFVVDGFARIRLRLMSPDSSSTIVMALPSTPLAGDIPFPGSLDASGTPTEEVFKTYSAPSIPAYFSGSGTLSLPVQVSGTFSVLDGNNVNYEAGGMATTESKVSIFYTFDTSEVPEPATMVLIGSSLFGLALVARRRWA